MSGTESPLLTTAQATDVLTAVANRLSIVLTSSSRLSPGDLANAALVPGSPELDVSELASGVINVAFLAKNVLFKTATPIDVPDTGTLAGDAVAIATDPAAGGTPFPAPLGTVTTSPNPITKNVPGDLGQVFGTLSLPKLTVKVDIAWTVARQNDPRDPTAGKTVLAEGHDFVALGGIASPTVSLAIPPPFSELRIDTLRTPQPDRVCLSASITLTFGAVADPPPNTTNFVLTKTFTLGPVDIILLPVLIPTVVALFAEPNFGVTNDGTVLIWVPEHSPLTSARALFDQLRRVEKVLDALRGVGGMAAWLLGLDELLDALPDQPRIRFKATNAISKLDDVEIKAGVFFGLGSTTFDDAVESLIVFGLPGTVVHFFNDTNFKTKPATNQGMYTIRLDSKTEPPRTVPRNAIAMTDFEPDTTDNDHDWEDSLSSVKFDDAWLRLIGDECRPAGRRSAGGNVRDHHRPGRSRARAPPSAPPPHPVGRCT